MTDKPLSFPDGPDSPRKNLAPLEDSLSVGFDMVNPVIPGPLKDKLGTGGFGVVYKDPRNPSQRCIKQYKNVAIGEEADRLMRFAAVDQWARPSDAKLMKSSFAWPLEVFGEVGRIQAFTMDTAPEDAHFELRLKNGNKSRRLLQLDFLIDPRYFSSNAIDATSAIIFSLQDRIELAIDICDSIMALHRYGLVYQDISSKNIVARQSNPRTCFLLDADSITTPEGASAKPIGSPTWEVPTGLEPLAVDRSRLALMTLRLIVQGHSVRPDNGCPELERRGYIALSTALRKTFETGEQSAADAMARELRLLRDAQHAEDAFTRAVHSRVARRIVQEGVSVRSVNHVNLVAAARLHVDREVALEDAELREQRKLLQSLRNQNSFSIDVLASVGLMPLPRTLDELHELAYNSYFSDVAQHLVRTGLPSLMSSPVMASIADRAIVEAEVGKISSSTTPGRGTLRIDWPNTDFVTAAEIRLFVGGVQQSIETVKRAPSDVFMKREIRAESGGTVTACVRFGINTLQGEVLLQHSTALQTDVVIPTVPIPAVVSTKRSGSVPMIDLVDPVEEARLEEIERLSRKRKKQKRVLLLFLAVILVLGGTWASSFFRNQEPNVLLETGYLKNQIEQGKREAFLKRYAEVGQLKVLIEAGETPSTSTTTEPGTTISTSPTTIAAP